MATRKNSRKIRPLSLLRGLFASIKCYALVGRSGTGKSFRAKLIAEKYGTELIIDDGLLIMDDKIIAGRSAKREAHYLSAIKTALFEDPTHRKEVIQAIKTSRAKKILIVGISRKMVEKVLDHLKLPPVVRWIEIEKIATKEEMKRATDLRSQGKHVIPVPAVEIKRRYATIFKDTIRFFLNYRPGLWQKPKKSSRIVEKSIVQPLFENRHRKGGVKITEPALSQMILHCIEECQCRLSVEKISFTRETSSYRITITAKAPKDQPGAADLHKLRLYISDRIERYSGIVIDKFDILIVGFLK